MVGSKADQGCGGHASLPTTLTRDVAGTVTDTSIGSYVRGLAGDRGMPGALKTAVPPNGPGRATPPHEHTHFVTQSNQRVTSARAASPSPVGPEADRPHHAIELTHLTCTGLALHCCIPSPPAPPKHPSATARRASRPHTEQGACPSRRWAFISLLPHRLVRMGEHARLLLEAAIALHKQDVDARGLGGQILGL